KIQASYYDELLYDTLIDNYNTTLSRPIENENDAIDVVFSLNLHQIMIVDEVNEIMSVRVWLTYKWKDYKLKWDPKKFNGIKQVNLDADLIWTPDILLYNSADEEIETKYETKVIVGSDGSIFWSPIAIVKFGCLIDINMYPFDQQKCHLIYGSWTYDDSKLNLNIKKSKFGISNYVQDGEWILNGDFPVKTFHFISYICFIDVTILLSLSLYSIILINYIPPTSISICILLKYFMLLITISGTSLISSIYLDNTFNRTTKLREMDRMHIRVFQFLTYIFKIKRTINNTSKTKEYNLMKTDRMFENRVKFINPNEKLNKKDSFLPIISVLARLCKEIRQIVLKDNFKEDPIVDIGKFEEYNDWQVYSILLHKLVYMLVSVAIISANVSIILIIPLYVSFIRK
ncbi:hypothetical protein A3Q56_07213, partial [Intoshia linei]